MMIDRRSRLQAEGLLLIVLPRQRPQTPRGGGIVVVG